MDPEKKEISNLNDDTEQTPEDFGKVIDALHSKQKLPSLRTYQGDMAEFIKEKNESVISIAVKEKEKKDEKKEEEKKFNPSPKSEPKLNKQSFRIKFAMVFLSLLLVAVGVASFYYVFIALKKQLPVEVVLKEDIIPYNNSVTLSNVTNDNLKTELGKLSLSNGVNVIKVSDSNGIPILKAKDFFSLLKISLPGTLDRTLKDEYVIGVISENQENSDFMIITVNDFGLAFSAMLDWEENMSKDLSFLGTETNTTVIVRPVVSAIASTTVSAIVSSAITPIKSGIFVWKDIIVKNKDTRGLVNEKNESKIAYTFLDKNTILITSNLSAIAEISSIYATRSVAR